MRLLFVENRYATWVYASVAARLAAQGHQIHWLVQNPMFAPRFGQVHRLPFPTSAAQPPASAHAYDWLRRTDRGVLHFGATDAHYAHYDGHIAAALGAAAPEVVFGEATEFHELLTIRTTRALGIPYLSPNATRYPPDRLVFMACDTLDPVGGDGTELSADSADTLLAAIRQRKVVPSYMRPVARSALAMVGPRLVDKLRVTTAWCRGERFITPSPLRKLALNAGQRRQRQRWDARAVLHPNGLDALMRDARPWVLYAMQMQPEGNIDVWGAPWNDQADLIRRAARSLAKVGSSLVVKPNPKSKYEMSADLNDVMDGEPNVVGLAHATRMEAVFEAAPLVLTVTGTVLLEAIFSGKPVASLGRHSMRSYPGVTPIETPEEVCTALADALAGQARTATRSQARALLQALHRTSFPATVWDPVAQPEMATDKNVARLTDAFVQVLAQVASHRAGAALPGTSREADAVAIESSR